jgi:hypothetical protein
VNNLNDPVDISEDVTPGEGLAPPKVDERGKKKEDDTRQVLAYGILAVLGLLYLLMLLAVVFKALTADDMVRVAGALSGFQTLAAAVAGFYFARGKHL